MILDTTYLLPLAKIDIDTDLLRAIADAKVKLSLRELTVSLISLFELQAKAASLSLPSDAVRQSIDAILSTFKVKPFYDGEVVDTSFRLRKLIPDYIDCVVTATAASLKEDLVTEDSRIFARRRAIEEEYGIKVIRYKDLVR